MFPTLLAGILASSDEAFVALDGAGVITAWSAAAERLLGLAAGDAIGRPAAEVVPGLQSGGLVATDRTPLSVTTSPLGDGGQLVIARPRVDDTSRWDVERLGLALAAARLGDWSWDNKSDVVTFSERAAEIFAIPPGPHMTWTAMRELIHPADAERARTAVERALERRADYALEYRLVNGGRERGDPERQQQRIPGHAAIVAQGHGVASIGTASTGVASGIPPSTGVSARARQSVTTCRTGALISSISSGRIRQPAASQRNRSRSCGASTSNETAASAAVPRMPSTSADSGRSSARSAWIVGSLSGTTSTSSGVSGTSSTMPGTRQRVSSPHGQSVSASSQGRSVRNWWA
jgi:PAS domain-containing protein